MAALALGSLVKGQAWPGISIGPRLSGPGNGANDGGINGKLRTMPEARAIAHHLDAPGVSHRGMDVHVG